MVGGVVAMPGGAVEVLLVAVASAAAPASQGRGVVAVLQQQLLAGEGILRQGCRPGWRVSLRLLRLLLPLALLQQHGLHLSHYALLAQQHLRHILHLKAHRS